MRRQRSGHSGERTQEHIKQTRSKEKKGGVAKRLYLGSISSTTSFAFPSSARFCLVAFRLARVAVPRTLGRGREAQARQVELGTQSGY